MRERWTAVMFHVHQDAASTTLTRSFEQYRYAIEAGLMSPHDVRRHILPWESATRDWTISRSSKRYHDHEDAYADVANKENADARCVCLLERPSRCTARETCAAFDRRRKALFGFPRASFSNRSPPTPPPLDSQPQRGKETVPESHATTWTEGLGMTACITTIRDQIYVLRRRCRWTAPRTGRWLSFVTRGPLPRRTSPPLPLARLPPCFRTTTTSRAP